VKGRPRSDPVLVEVGEDLLLDLRDLLDDAGAPGLGLAQPLEDPEVHDADRVAVGAIGRVVERLRHRLLHPRGDRVLDAVRLGVDLVPGHAELLHEEALDQTVPAQDRVRQPPALRGEHDRAALLAHQVALAGEALQHLRRRRQRDLERAGQDGRSDPVAVLLEPLDLFQVVLDAPHRTSVLVA
jgi:hypothetical protein